MSAELSDLERSDAELLRILDGELEEGARRAGAWLACRPGCTECCIGPFPITRLDARRLGRGLDELARKDPGTAERVRARSASAVERLRESFPGDPETGVLDEARVEPFLERHAGEPCPALDLRTGRCDVYAWRPVSCRTYGPPARFGATLEPPCRLCFAGASDPEIERCRIEPDREGREHAILGMLERIGERDDETLVAFALARPGAVLP